MTTFNTSLYASIICRKPQQRYQLIDNKLITIDTVSILNVFLQNTASDVINKASGRLIMMLRHGGSLMSWMPHTKA